MIDVHCWHSRLNYMYRQKRETVKWTPALLNCEKLSVWSSEIREGTRKSETDSYGRGEWAREWERERKGMQVREG